MSETEYPPGDSENNSKPDDSIASPGFESRAHLPFPVVGIGASAGGIQALESFFDNVPADSGMAFVVVQHLSPDHTSLLQDILGRHARIPVTQIVDGMAVEPNHAYVIAPGFTLTLESGVLRLGMPVEKRGHRRPVDDFFRSLATEQNERAIAVILSGTGTNGTSGAQAIKAAGGICIAQQPESASFPGMPRSLINAGYADQVLDPAEIPRVLIRYSNHPYAGPDEAARADEEALQRDAAQLREVLAILRTRTRHDFAGYRKATLLRRIQRRMGLTDVATLAEYADKLRAEPEEVSGLSNDLMINVTGFFRDPEAWEVLKTEVLAPLLASKQDGQTVRCWVTACASGEEPYTLAMLIAEELNGRRGVDVKIFATDTADRSLSLARIGVYPGGIEADMTPARLDRFFEKEEHTFRIKKEIRDMVVFAPQDILRDPPFSRIDLSTCRNLLIYLEPETQRRVLALLHFSLREGGYLFLGNTESFSGSEHLFEVLSKKWRMFRRTPTGPSRFGDVPGLSFRNYDDAPNGLHDNTIANQQRPSATLVLQRALLERYGPPTVIVDRSDRVLYFHGATGEFLESPPGEPTRDLMLLLRTPLRIPVRSALRSAVQDNASFTVSAPLGDDEGRTVEITAAPVIPSKMPEYFLVSFAVSDSSGKATDGASVAANDAPTLDERRLLRLELLNTTEAYEATNEELKAAHEEATSMNEELQSANEELETSKEELQSINEELTTVNNQLQSKIGQLEATTNDLSNLLSSTDIAVVFLDADFRVRRFTPSVTDLLELIDSDIGRPITDLAQKFQDDKLLLDSREVLLKLIPVEREVQSTSGRWYTRRVLPYRTAENRIEGVVITFLDVSVRKKSEQEITRSRDRLQGVLEQMPTAVVILEAPSGRLMYANERAAALFGYTFISPIPANTTTLFQPLIRGTRANGEPYRVDDWPMARSLANNEVVTDEEIGIAATDSYGRVLSVSSAPVRDELGKTVAVVGTFLDISQRKRGEQMLADAERRFRLLVESASDFAIFVLDTRGMVMSWNQGAERILGWAEAEILDKSADIVFTPEDRASQVPQFEIKQALATGRAEDERWHMRKDGSRFWASGVMSTMLSPKGAITGLVKIMRDTTDSKIAEDRLRAAIAEAERASAAAEDANRAKDEFIAVVSHELRTPLNTIRLWTRMLGNEKLPAKDRADGIQMMERAAIAQQQVIDDLFDVSRIASGKLRLAMRESRLADAVKAAVAAVEPVAGARGIRLTAEVASTIGNVRADPGRMQQVVWNLLSNAVKFTPQGGTVRVIAWREDNDVVIEVKDSGVGIKPEFLPHVFDRFRQAEVGTTRVHGGLGLGLAIAQQIVELHNGSISVASDGDGKGATFRIVMPLAVISSEDTQTDLPAVPGLDELSGVDILLVEDESSARKIMQHLLEGHGAKVRSVDSVAGAREELDMRLPHMLISDIGLPGEDGYSLMRHVRTLKEGGAIKAIAVTAFASGEDRRRALDAGFNLHVAKPLDPDRLLKMVAKLARAD